MSPAKSSPEVPTSLAYLAREVAMDQGGTLQLLLLELADEHDRQREATARARRAWRKVRDTYPDEPLAVTLDAIRALAAQQAGDET